jgi:hypothetical protein
MTASRPLSNDQCGISQYQLIMAELQRTIQAAAHENKKLLDLVKFYANTDWRDLSMRDRGAAARQMVKEVNGG